MLRALRWALAGSVTAGPPGEGNALRPAVRSGAGRVKIGAGVADAWRIVSAARCAGYARSGTSPVYVKVYPLPARTGRKNALHIPFARWLSVIYPTDKPTARNP